MTNRKINSSFRDPSGFVFEKDGVLYRQINDVYKENYELFIESGLYKELKEKNLIISHEDADNSLSINPDHLYKIIKPVKVPFISYPYEWSFGMYKDSALLTLEILKISLKYNMILKDSSSYNIQFIDSKPIFIDTLSFDKYEEGKPWEAYQQFCKHFLSPLVLMTYVSIDLSKLMQIYIDGIPLDLTSKILPLKAKINPSIYMHIIMHSKSQEKHSLDAEKILNNQKILVDNKVSKQGLLSIIDNLESIIRNLKWNKPKTEWGDYYHITNYSEFSMEQKSKMVADMILKTKPKMLWDLGANNGPFSRLASGKGIETISFDIDPVAVELNYQECRKNGDKNLLPLISDLTNPSPDIGFSNKERDSLIRRGPADTILALALIHHLSISNNLPFENTARFFSECGEYLIIEFVPKNDSQVKKLLASRKDIFDRYDIESFRNDYSLYFDILEEKNIENSERILFLMKKKTI